MFAILELKQYGVYDVEQISKDISPGDHCLVSLIAYFKYFK